MFHVKDGLYFERVNAFDEGGNPIEGEQFGSVRIKVLDHESTAPGQYAPVIFEQVLTVEEWASVVSSMTVIGEAGPGLGAAIEALQRGG